MRLLDVGYGVGSITSGTAEAVGASGLVPGLDRLAGLLRIAREHYASAAHFWFIRGGVSRLPVRRSFGVVTSARTPERRASAGPLVVVGSLPTP